MTTHDIELVRNSWGTILVHKEEAGNIFYKTLFELSPDVRDLFKTDIRAQNQKLMSSITLIVTKLNKLDNIREEIRFLAKRHLNYKVRTDFFIVFGKAFIAMLAKILQEVWTPEMENAWTKVYTLVSQAMIDELNDSHK